MILSEKAKTSYEIFLLWNEQVDKSQWVRLETAQQLEKVIGQYETALQKITAIAEEDEAKIAEALSIIDEHMELTDTEKRLRGCLAGENTK